MKLPAAPMPAASIAPIQTEMTPVDDSGMPPVDMGAEQPEMGAEQGSEDMPFGKEKFDAGIGDEDTDPKKYIEKLTGKLAQKLRDYNGTEQDVDLNKFVINSLIPAAIPQMDDTDAKDVIKKVQDNIGGASGQAPEQSNGEVDDTIAPVDNELPPLPQSENKEANIDDLINEILGHKKLSRNIKNKTPFKGPKFK